MYVCQVFLVYVVRGRLRNPLNLRVNHLFSPTLNIGTYNIAPPTELEWGPHTLLNLADSPMNGGSYCLYLENQINHM